MRGKDNLQMAAYSLMFEAQQETRDTEQESARDKLPVFLCLHKPVLQVAGPKPRPSQRITQ